MKMTFWIESDPLVENFLQNHRAFDVLHLEPPYEHVNKVDEGELDQSAEHLHSRLYILFSSFFTSYFLYQSLLDHEMETHRDKAENDEDVHCRCISDLQQKVWKYQVCKCTVMYLCTSNLGFCLPPKSNGDHGQSTRSTKSWPVFSFCIFVLLYF